MPITLTCSGCGRSFQLRDEMAGRKVRCPDCQSVQVVPGLDAEEVTFGSDAYDEALRVVCILPSTASDSCFDKR